LDRKTSEDNRIAGYLGTSRGRLKKYDPVSRRTSLMSPSTCSVPRPFSGRKD
jgi:hypothetical protein